MKLLKRILLAIVLIAILLPGAALLWLNRIVLMPAGEIPGFSDAAQSVSDLHVPEDAEIIALGEATHGNVEFQALRLEVFRKLVEQNGIRAFALEADFGQCALINDYIQTGEGTAEDCAASLAFDIYHTQQMIDLIGWMRSYNEAAQPGDEVRFYGFDIQNPGRTAARLLNYCEEQGIVQTDLLTEVETIMSTSSGTLDTSRLAEMEQDAAALEAQLSAMDAPDAYAVQAATCLRQYFHMLMGSADYNTLRDEAMAENVSWILTQEQQLGRKAIMIGGHNGHIGKQGRTYTNLGSRLHKTYGDSYYAIGTDFHRTLCSINSQRGRGNHAFKSCDPLAAQLERSGMDSAYLDFAAVPESESALYSTIHSPMWMGTLSEGYFWYMPLLPQFYNVSQTPAEVYDSMIFVRNASPVQVLNAD